ncbi:MAG: hypothetical protein AB7O88_00675 [Reyranellaceae bacterium]
MPSKKTEVIEILFERLCPEGELQAGKRYLVTRSEVAEAIRARNSRYPDEKAKEEEIFAKTGVKKIIQLSDGNPPNFLKDFIRKPTANKNWPAALTKKRITGKQAYGETYVLEFVPFGQNDTVPFPDRFLPFPGMPVVAVESLSLPRAARALGRTDEAWLSQVVVYQRIIHHHLAVISSLNVVDLSHLQMSVKTQPEIDAIFVATLLEKGVDFHALVTCEAKQLNERILEDQIREQIAAGFATTLKMPDATKIDAIIPVAVQVVTHPVDGANKRGVYVLEFEMVRRSEFDAKYADEKRRREMELVPASRAFYHLHPTVSGVSDTRSAMPKPLPAEEQDGDEEE